MLICLCLTPGIASSETTGRVLIGSKHSGGNQWNDFNPGLLVTVEEEGWISGVTAGAFYNSEANLSVVAGLSKSWDVRKGILNVSISLLAATGYEYAPVVPMVIFTAEFFDRFDLHLTPDPINKQVVFTVGWRIFEF